MYGTKTEHQNARLSHQSRDEVGSGSRGGLTCFHLFSSLVLTTQLRLIIPLLQTQKLSLKGVICPKAPQWLSGRTKTRVFLSLKPEFFQLYHTAYKNRAIISISIFVLNIVNIYFIRHLLNILSVLRRQLCISNPKLLHPQAPGREAQLLHSLSTAQPRRR